MSVIGLRAQIHFSSEKKKETSNKREQEKSNATHTQPFQTQHSRTPVDNVLRFTLSTKSKQSVCAPRGGRWTDTAPVASLLAPCKSRVMAATCGFDNYNQLQQQQQCRS
jgi:hypothetical protein